MLWHYGKKGYKRIVSAFTGIPLVLPAQLDTVQTKGIVLHYLIVFDLIWRISCYVRSDSMNNLRIMEQGKLDNGTWQLFENGMLVVQGQGTLAGVDFENDPERITAVEVRGFDTIGSWEFARLPMLRKVVLDASVKVIEEGAFYGCCQLSDISNDGNVEVADHAFDGIAILDPLFTEKDKEDFEYLNGVPYTHFPLENPLEHTCMVNMFWDEIRDCLQRLEGFGYYDEKLFVPAVRLLHEGAEAEDPVLMFLWAEFLYWGTMTGDGGGGSDLKPWDRLEVLSSTTLYSYYPDRRKHIMFDPDEYEECEPGRFEKEYGCLYTWDDPYFWYDSAAEAGYVPAMCWLGWCKKRGIGGDRDEKAMKYWFDKAGKYPPVSDFCHHSLHLFRDAGAALGDLARAEDLMEDSDASSYGYDGGSYPWREHFAGSVIAYKMGCLLGCPKCGQANVVYTYDACESRERRRMCVEKRLWQIYCAVNGIGLKDVSAKTLRSWLKDIDNAIHYRYAVPLKLDKETEELLSQLTAEVESYECGIWSEVQ